MLSKAKKIPSALLTAAILLAILLFLIFPARYANAVQEGIYLWAISVLPATFPMLFLTAIFTKRRLFSRLTKVVSPISGKCFRVSGAGACAALLSIISGYPVGARTVYDLAQNNFISGEERLRVAALATTSGPAFMVGAVGSGMFHSPAIGWILYLSHLIGIFFICLLLRFTSKEKPSGTHALPAGKISLSEVLTSSVLSVLCVGGAIAVFYAFGAMIADMGAMFSLPRSILTALRGLLEMTTGCSLLAENTTPLSIAASCFFVTFGGLCVLIQQLAFLMPAGIRATRFVLIKFVQGIASALMCFAISLLFGL